MDLNFSTAVPVLKTCWILVELTGSGLWSGEYSGKCPCFNPYDLVRLSLVRSPVLQGRTVCLHCASTRGFNSAPTSVHAHISQWECAYGNAHHSGITRSPCMCSQRSGFSGFHLSCPKLKQFRNNQLLCKYVLTLTEKKFWLPFLLISQYTIARAVLFGRYFISSVGIKFTLLHNMHTKENSMSDTAVAICHSEHKQHETNQKHFSCRKTDFLRQENHEAWITTSWLRMAGLKRLIN